MSQPTHRKQFAMAKPTKSLWCTRDLLGLTAILSGFFAILAYVGFNHVIWNSLVLSGVLAAASFSLLPRNMRLASLGAATAGVFLSLNIFLVSSSAMIVNYFIHVLWMLWPRRKVPTVKRALLVSMSISLVSFVLACVLGISSHLELIELRAQYPPLDLSQRLIYEQQALDKRNATESDVNRVVDKWLDFEESYRDLDGKSWGNKFNLRGLHDKSVESFVKSSGFGVGRMIPHKPTREDFSNLHFGEIHHQFRYGFTNTEGFHFRNVLDFLDPHTIGIQDREGTRVGFKSHAISRSVDTLRYDVHGIGQLQNLQLVSLLKFESPRVYVLDHLPRMDQLSSDTVETRPLNEFETMALEKLRKGAVIVSNLDSIDSESRPDKMSALGGIVAIESCLECHCVKKGELLGAFTYEFQLVPSNGLSKK